jgi:hypothetical protein
MPINFKSKFSNVSLQAGVPLDITDKILFYKSRNTEFKKSLKQSQINKDNRIMVNRILDMCQPKNRSPAS